ncbi:hypothetical protein [Thiohalorhabdus sp.]|uniref:hypothetical protein n=1 Tax=Thiohalorhabdus sp. TaxID=3094134 RepID=UPI002FC36C53
MGWLGLPLRAMAYAALLEVLTLVIYYGVGLGVVLLAVLLGSMSEPGGGEGAVLAFFAFPFLYLALYLPEWLALPWSLYLQELLAGGLARDNMMGPPIRAAILFPPLALNAFLLLAGHRLIRALRPARESP